MPGAYSVYRYDLPMAPAVTAGGRAILIGAQSGLFPTFPGDVPGGMGGLWAGEMKLLSGFYFAVDDVPLRESDAYEVDPAGCAFHYRMAKQGLHVVRRQFVPDGVPGCAIELTLENLTDAPRMAEISFTARTDILTAAAARGEDGLELGRDVCEYDERLQAFFARDSRNPWHVVFGAERGCRALAADLPREIYGFGAMPGKGVNGRAFYRVRLAPRAQASLRLIAAGGFPSRSKAEDAIERLREEAGSLYEKKSRRVEGMMAAGRAELPDERLARAFNWAKVYLEWMTCAVGASGRALCADLTLDPMLYGEDWARAVRGLLPVGRADEAARMLETVAALCEKERLAPGRVPLSVTPGGRVVRTGGPKESARFVALVWETLRYGGDRTLAARLLPQTGLCLAYLRRATGDFARTPPELLADVREAIEAQAGILRAAGSDDAPARALLARLPEAGEAGEDTPPEGATLWEKALFHGERAHVERMIGCLTAMARAGQPGLPGGLRGEDERPGVLVTAVATAGFVWAAARCLFGLRPDATQRLIEFAPRTPIGWTGWRASDLTIGTARFSASSERVSPSRARYTLRASEPGWRVCVTSDGQSKEYELDDELSLILSD